MNSHTLLLHVLGGSEQIETWCLVLKYLDSYWNKLYDSLYWSRSVLSF